MPAQAPGQPVRAAGRGDAVAAAGAEAAAIVLGPEPSSARAALARLTPLLDRGLRPRARSAACAPRRMMSVMPRPERDWRTWKTPAQNCAVCVLPRGSARSRAPTLPRRVSIVEPTGTLVDSGSTAKRLRPGGGSGPCPCRDDGHRPAELGLLRGSAGARSRPAGTRSGSHRGRALGPWSRWVGGAQGDGSHPVVLGVGEEQLAVHRAGRRSQAVSRTGRRAGGPVAREARLPVPAIVSMTPSRRPCAPTWPSSRRRGSRRWGTRPSRMVELRVGGRDPVGVGPASARHGGDRRRGSRPCGRGCSRGRRRGSRPRAAAPRRTGSSSLAVDRPDRRRRCSPRCPCPPPRCWSP